MGPHVRGDGGRKGVVGQPFCALSWVGEGGGGRGGLYIGSACHVMCSLCNTPTEDRVSMD